MNAQANVTMERDGVRAEVANNESVQIMEGQGWKVVADDAELAALRAKAEAVGVGYGSDMSADELRNKLAEFDRLAAAPKAPADMTATELKAELTAAGVDFAGNASKAVLIELVTAARAKAAGAQQ